MFNAGYIKIICILCVLIFIYFTYCLTLFADDITMFCSGKNICAVRDMMTVDMGSVYEWLNNNQLILNWDKTKAMCFFYSSHNQIDPHIQPTNIFISIDGQY